MSRVRTRARCRTDRAGDPMDGLVNLFDLGIVLSVAFLVAALQSLNLAKALTQGDAAKLRRSSSVPTITLKHDQHLERLKPGERRVKVSSAGKVGSVYRLPNGSLVYVQSSKGQK
jgi:hypothetical protein